MACSDGSTGGIPLGPSLDWVGRGGDFRYVKALTDAISHYNLIRTTTASGWETAMPEPGRDRGEMTLWHSQAWGLCTLWISSGIRRRREDISQHHHSEFEEFRSDWGVVVKGAKWGKHCG
jgi:hypothetical protein